MYVLKCTCVDHMYAGLWHVCYSWLWAGWNGCWERNPDSRQEWQALLSPLICCLNLMLLAPKRETVSKRATLDDREQTTLPQSMLAKLSHNLNYHIKAIAQWHWAVCDNGVLTELVFFVLIWLYIIYQIILQSTLQIMLLIFPETDTENYAYSPWKVFWNTVVA